MFNWVSKLFTGAEVDAPRRTTAPHIAPVAAHNGYLWPALADTTAQAGVYAASPWVYVAVNRIAEACALVPLHVYRMDGEARSEVVRHPLEDLLERPNPHLSRFELFEQTIGYLELTGDAYWFLVGDVRGTPVEIWPLRPDRVSIVPHPERYVAGYVYEIDGQRIPMEAAEVVHFKRWHPLNDYYGLSALEAARLAIRTDKAMSEWNHNTFGQNNGVPAGIVNIKEFVTDADFERIKREWRMSYGGPQRRTAFLRGGGIEWHDIGLSHTDLDFLQGRAANREEILNIFGVPLGLVSDNATEANAKVAERTFIERTLWPKLARVAQKITQEMLPFWPGDHRATFEDIRPTDTQARLDEIRTAGSVLSINEIRAQYYHLPPVEWGAYPAGMALSQDSVGTRPAVSGKQNPSAINTDESAPTVETVKTADILTELAQWERFTLKRFGKARLRPFETQVIPDELAFEVRAGLLAADSPDAAEDVFNQARARLVGEGLLTVV